MRILLDTHLIIWWMKNDRHLSKKARQLITDADEAYISSASIWEIGIKVRIGKLTIDINNFEEEIEKEGFLELPITIKHASIVSTLPDHHRDPFDRMLIAQAISEPLHFLTADKILDAYSSLVEVV